MTKDKSFINLGCQLSTSLISRSLRSTDAEAKTLCWWKMLRKRTGPAVSAVRPKVLGKLRRKFIFQSLGGRIGVHNGWDFGHHAGPVVLVFFVIYINPFPYELAKS